MSRRQRITYPTGNLQTRVATKYSVGSIVFLPFVLTRVEQDVDAFYSAEPSHEFVSWDDNNNALVFPANILP